MSKSYQFECTECGEMYDYGTTVRMEDTVVCEWDWLGRLLFREKEFTLPTLVADKCPECGNSEYEEHIIYD